MGRLTLSDFGVRRNPRDLQCFRMRAGEFAIAQGRLNGMPGRITGARAKGLPLGKQREVSQAGESENGDLRFEIWDGSFKTRLFWFDFGIQPSGHQWKSARQGWHRAPGFRHETVEE
jgi:hypothetical protein